MLQRLLDKFLCLHDWEEKECYTTMNTETKSILSVKKLYICKKCGKMKVIYL